MDIEKYEDELGKIMDNVGSYADPTSKEYTVGLNNISKLQSVIHSEKDMISKEERYTDETDFRDRQIKVEEQKVANETLKANNQHIENMKDYELKEKELKIRAQQVENESQSLKIKELELKKEIKSSKRRDWTMFLLKGLGICAVTGINIWMYKDSIKFERKENGILPKECNSYKNAINKSYDTIMK